jgi:catechol 2,3-dioxygenase-like lactoylglutathione lyase family enzyme
MMSVTLAAADLDKAALFYTQGLGMREAGGPDELAEIHVPAPSASPLLSVGSSRRVLTFGAPHNTATVILEQGGRPADAVSEAGAVEAPVLSVVVQDLAAAFSRVSSLGAETSPFTPGSDKSFVCADPDGNAVHVLAAA